MSTYYFKNISFYYVPYFQLSIDPESYKISLSFLNPKPRKYAKNK